MEKKKIKSLKKFENGSWVENIEKGSVREQFFNIMKISLGPEFKECKFSDFKEGHSVFLYFTKPFLHFDFKVKENITFIYETKTSNTNYICIDGYNQHKDVIEFNVSGINDSYIAFEVNTVFGLLINGISYKFNQKITRDLFYAYIVPDNKDTIIHNKILGKTTLFYIGDEPYTTDDIIVLYK